MINTFSVWEESGRARKYLVLGHDGPVSNTYFRGKSRLQGYLDPLISPTLITDEIHFDYNI